MTDSPLSLADGFVCVEADLDELPLPAPLDGVSPELVEMDMGDPGQIEQYLSVHNSAFPIRWGLPEYEGAILRHPAKRVTRTFLVRLDGVVAGSASIGVFRENPAIGLGHYLGVKREYQRIGLGRWLVLQRFQRLRADGLRGVEVETRWRYRPSILLHFGCGFRPKLSPDRWNTPQSEPPALTFATRRAVEELYSSWRLREAS
jgi:GNAT superfamily N-acetyltransferase